MKPAPLQIPVARGRAAGQAAFTLVEIAISLAIIGFALVAIIGVLPIGMNVQRENREETIINQDAAVFMDAIRSGARGLDDLTNAVFAITNFWTYYEVTSTSTNVRPPLQPPGPDHDGYTYTESHVTSISPQPPPRTLPINNGFLIVGLLGTPKYVFDAGGFYSNHIVAYVRALSGLAVEKFPQINPFLQTNQDAYLDVFSYRLIPENVQIPVPPEHGTNLANSSSRQLTHNLHELRLLFRWPFLLSGKTGNGRQIFRTLVGGMLTNDPLGGVTWFFQPQTFVKAP